MAKVETSPPTAAYEILYVGSHRYPDTHPATFASPPNPPTPYVKTPGTTKDVYQTALVFAAALNIAPKYRNGQVKVALLGDAVLALAPTFLSTTPDPPHARRPSVDALIKQLNDLNKQVEIWY